MLGRASIQPVPTVEEYLTDGKRLLMVLCHDDEGRVVCEDARAPSDRPAPIIRIEPGELGLWQRVPLADAA